MRRIQKVLDLDRSEITIDDSQIDRNISFTSSSEADF
jgi:hypothetical protein